GDGGAGDIGGRVGPSPGHVLGARCGCDPVTRLAGNVVGTVVLDANGAPSNGWISHLRAREADLVVLATDGNNEVSGCRVDGEVHRDTGNGAARGMRVPDANLMRGGTKASDMEDIEGAISAATTQVWWRDLVRPRRCVELLVNLRGDGWEGGPVHRVLV